MGLKNAKTRARPEYDDARSITWIAVSFTDSDRALIDEIARIGGFARLDEIVVAGLWQLAKQLDAPITAFSRRVDRLGLGRFT